MVNEKRSRIGSHWFWIAAIWGGIGLFDGTQQVVVMRSMGMHHAWVAMFFRLFLGWLPWALATPLIMQMAARHRLAAIRSRPAAVGGAHLATWIGVMLAADAWGAGLSWVLNPWTPERPVDPYSALFIGNLEDNLLTSIVLYACILMAGTALDAGARMARHRVEAAQLAEALAKAQLDALRHQIEPHFLFNALNAVSGLVREGANERAVETLARVSEFLRHLLQESGRQEVPLAEELRFATMYLGIQQVRFAERLAVDVQVGPGLEHAIVPRLILQPIVENAIKHGIARRVQPGAVAIGATREAGRILLTVYNDGPSIAANDDPAGTAIGLANVRSRLRGLHGDAAALDVANVDTRGVRVSIAVPFREAG
jgi:two-component system LytT family sensor kinase